jgi:hypothetical protein
MSSAPMAPSKLASFSLSVGSPVLFGCEAIEPLKRLSTLSG